VSRYWPLVAIAVLLAGWWLRQRKPAADVIEYRGEKIKLSRAYNDWSDYKNDPNNIAPFETARVQKLVMEAPIAHSFSSRLEMFRASVDISFPGYGSGSGQGAGPDGSELVALTHEIPRADKERYILFRGRNGHYELLDDFVEREIPYSFDIREEGGFYIYYQRDGREAFRRPVRAAN
jgi:hypothetical protein